MNTSSTCGAMPAWRARSCLMTVAARSSVRTRASTPWKRPIGVRTKSQMYASLMNLPLAKTGSTAIEGAFPLPMIGGALDRADADPMLGRDAARAARDFHLVARLQGLAVDVVV